MAFTFVAALALTALGFVIAWRMDSTQGFHAIMSVFLDADVAAQRRVFSAPPWQAGMSLAQQGLAIVMGLNPLTYGVAGLRRLLYWPDSSPPLAPDTPSLAACWAVMVIFAVAAFALSWKISARRTTADLL